MEEIQLEVQVRSEVGSQKIKSVRRQDCVPAIVYGGKKKPTAIKMDRRTYEKIRREHQGESVVFHINVFEGEKKLRDYAALMKEEQLNPVTDRVLHVDFKRISLKQNVEVKVALSAVGEAIGVKKDGGALDHVLWELDIICLPTQIPQHIDVDVSALEIGASIHLKDITLPEGVTTKHDPEAILFSVTELIREEEAVEIDADAEPEVIGEKKKDASAEETKAEDKKE